MLDDVLELLQCPVCKADLARSGRVLRCAGGHSFDIARQGYVSLVAGPAGDSAEMVAARLAFLEGGHLEPLVARVAERCAELAPTGDGAVLELGAGAGHQLARVLDLLPNRARPGARLLQARATAGGAGPPAHRRRGLRCLERPARRVPGWRRWP